MAETGINGSKRAQFQKSEHIKNLGLFRYHDGSTICLLHVASGQDSETGL